MGNVHINSLNQMKNLKFILFCSLIIFSDTVLDQIRNIFSSSLN